MKNQQQLDANTTAINVDKIGDGILVDNDIRDLKREQSALQLQKNQNTLDELAQQDLIKQSEKNYSSKMDISNQEQTIYIQSLETETERKENFTDIERIKASTNQANELLDTKDGLETKKSTLGIDLVEDKVEEQGATTTKKQEQNQGKKFNLNVTPS